MSCLGHGEKNIKKDIEPRIIKSGPLFVFDSIDSDWWRKSKWKGEKSKDGNNGMPQLNSISFKLVINKNFYFLFSCNLILLKSDFVIRELVL